MEAVNWIEIIGLVLLVISVLFGAKWRQAKGLLKEVAEALTGLSDAVADDKITEAEQRQLLKDFAEVIEAARNLINR